MWVTEDTRKIPFVANICINTGAFLQIYMNCGFIVALIQISTYYHINVHKSCSHGSQVFHVCFKHKVTTISLTELFCTSSIKEKV